MSVYSEMLLQALRQEPDDRSVPDLIEQALAFGSSQPEGGDTAARLAHNLAYDVTLVRLCDHLEIDHDLTGDRAGPLTRSQAEATLAAHLPSWRQIAMSQQPRREH